MTINLEALETQAKKACSIDGITPPCIFVESEVILALIARIRELENTLETHAEPRDRPFIATIERPSNY